MENKIPTAAEILKKHDKGFSTQTGEFSSEYVVEQQNATEAMIEYAKIHAKAQIDAILSNVTTRFIPFTDDEEVDKKSIIEAYPLDNIK